MFAMFALDGSTTASCIKMYPLIDHESVLLKMRVRWGFRLGAPQFQILNPYGCNDSSNMWSPFCEASRPVLAAAWHLACNVSP